MFTHPQQGIDQDAVTRLRQEAGKWLRSLREAAGLTQREFAKSVGIEYYTFISQIESGRGRVPPAQTYAWATVLNVPPREFAIQLMRYYDPLSYRIIFGEDVQPQHANSNASLEARILRLERLLDKE